MIPYSSSNMNKDEGTLIPIYDGIYYKSSYTVSKSSINYVSFRITPNINIDSISIIISKTSSVNTSITLILVFFVFFLIICIFCLIFLLCKRYALKLLKVQVLNQVLNLKFNILLFSQQIWSNIPLHNLNIYNLNHNIYLLNYLQLLNIWLQVNFIKVNYYFNYYIKKW